MPENPTRERPERKRLTGAEAARIREVCESFEAACAEHIPCDDRLRACAIAAITEATVTAAANPAEMSTDITGAIFASHFRRFGAATIAGVQAALNGTVATVSDERRRFKARPPRRPH